MKQQRIDTLEDLLNQPIIKCIMAGIIPAVILLFVYMGLDIYPYEKLTLINSDLSEYVSFLAYLKRLLEEGGSFLYSFSKTLGGDFMPVLTYYLLSPFNLVLLFVSLEDIPYAVFLIIVLKTMACGITMFLFLSSKNNYRFYNVFFSTAYALSGYMIMFQTHIMWLDGVILLPLIALGIDRIIEKKKSALYIISLAVSIIICYYTGYMSCIFAVLYFLYHLVLCGKETKKRNRIVKFAIASVCAVGGSAAILFPAVSALFNTKFASAQNLVSENTFLFHPFDLTSKFFTAAGNNAEFQTGIPFVFCGILTFALLVQSFFCKKIRMKEKILHVCILTFFWISFCVGIIDKIWHGFAIPNNFNHRYSFVFIFFVIFIAWKTLSVILVEKEFSVFSAVATWGSILILAIGVILNHYSYLDTVMVLLDVAIVSAGILLLYFAVRCETDLSGLFLVGFGIIFFVNLYMNGIGLLKDRPYQDTSITGYVKEVEDTVSYIQRYDNGLYRMEQDFHYSHNDAMLFGYRGLSHFSSAETSSVLRFMGRLGYNRYFDYWAKYGEGATLAGDSLLGMKYFLSRADQPYLEKFHQDATITAYYNPYSLELGFTVKEDILSKISWQENVFENQNVIYTKITGRQGNILVTFEADEIPVGMQYDEEEKIWQSEEVSASEYLMYRFRAENDNPVYVYLPSSGNGSVVVYVNETKVATWLDDENSGILPLGSFETGESVEVVLKPNERTVGMSDIIFAYLDMEEFEDRINGLKQNSWYLYESTDTRIEAEVTAEEDEVLFLSIPYEKNWKIYVDGIETCSVEVLDLFMAVELSAGTHHIVLRYQNPTLILGFFVTILCTFATIFIIILENRKKKRHINDGELLSVQ